MSDYFGDVIFALSDQPDLDYVPSDIPGGHLKHEYRRLVPIHRKPKRGPLPRVWRTLWVPLTPARRRRDNERRESHVREADAL